MKKCLIASLVLGTIIAGCNNMSKAERYAKEATELNKQCPRALDEFTTMDSVHYLGDLNRFTYYYSVHGLADSILIAQKENLELQLFEQLINSPDMRPYITDSISFQYIYHSEESDSLLMDILIESQRF